MNYTKQYKQILVTKEQHEFLKAEADKNHMKLIGYIQMIVEKIKNGEC